MGYYFLGFGSLILALAGWATARSLKLLLFGVRRQGVVVGVDEQMRRGDSQRKKVYFHPIIEFQTPEGNTFQFTFGRGSPRSAPRLGREVKVVYPPDSPDKATLESFIGLWAGPLAATLLGGGCLYGGIQIVFFGA